MRTAQPPAIISNEDIVLSASKPDEELDEEPFAELIDDETREAKGEPATCALKEKVTLPAACTTASRYRDGSLQNESEGDTSRAPGPFLSITLGLAGYATPDNEEDPQGLISMCLDPEGSLLKASVEKSIVESFLNCATNAVRGDHQEKQPVPQAQNWPLSASGKASTFLSLDGSLQRLDALHWQPNALGY
ncbi:hypothetical protein RRG08_021709 [Elysia crispata]|uniref:Uncharacterized protein n=1 Tax=Elysia crispata TaxID=231223 RepID=A0AAE0ZYG6_9GAST|nr:hypothetical protein RRG08_021709 [Elysia crispata]